MDKASHTTETSLILHKAQGRVALFKAYNNAAIKVEGWRQAGGETGNKAFVSKFKLSAINKQAATAEAAQIPSL